MNREPIHLSAHAVALIHIFDRTDYLEDGWTFAAPIDVDLFYKTAAKQFISQLEGYGCVAFLEALRDEIKDVLDNDC